MAIKYDNSSVRLWMETSKAGDTNLGIRFNTSKNEEEIESVYTAINAILELKYGKGTE